MTSETLLGSQLKDLLTGLSDQSRQHLSEVEKDLTQTTALLAEAIDKLGASFMGIHAAVSRQQQAVNELLLQHATAPELGERFRRMESEIGTHVNAAVTGLQFQDMTSQLIARTIRRVAGVKGVLDTVDATSAKQLPASSADEIADLIVNLNRVLADQSRQLECLLNKPVAQTHMNSGDIELF